MWKVTKLLLVLSLGSCLQYFKLTWLENLGTMSLASLVPGRDIWERVEGEKRRENCNNYSMIPPPKKKNFKLYTKGIRKASYLSVSPWDYRIYTKENCDTHALIPHLTMGFAKLCLRSHVSNSQVDSYNWRDELPLLDIVFVFVWAVFIMQIQRYTLTHMRYIICSGINSSSNLQKHRSSLRLTLRLYNLWSIFTLIPLECMTLIYIKEIPQKSTILHWGYLM